MVMPRGRPPKRITAEREAAMKRRVEGDVAAFLEAGGKVENVPFGVGKESLAKSSRSPAVARRRWAGATWRT